MTKSIDEIVESIYQEPDEWCAFSGKYSGNHLDGLTRDNIEITGHGNGKWLSVIHLEINGLRLRTETWRDLYRLEKAISWWYANCDLATLSNAKNID